MKKRILALALAALTALGLAPALAEENAAASLAKQVQALAFETPNVTLTAAADFLWDGGLFKRAEITQRQDGMDSLQQARFITPEGRSAAYTGTYDVYAQGNQVYVLESFNESYYQPWVRSAGATASLINDTSLRRAALKLAASLGEPLGDRLTAEGGGYRLAIGKGESPALIDDVVNLLVQSELRRRGYGPTRSAAGCDIEYEEYNSALRAWAQKRDAKYDEAFFEKYYSGGLSDEEQQDVWELMEQYREELDALADGHDAGVLCVRADGSTLWYKTRNEYLRAKDGLRLVYELYSKTMSDYAKERGAEITQAMIRGDEPMTIEQSDELSKLNDEMMDSYLQQVRDTPDAIGAYIRADGTADVLANQDKLNAYYDTPSRMILNTLSSIAVESADATISADAEGRLTGAKGTLAFAVTDCFDEVHTLTITFDVSASDYGTTDFERFDPKTSKLPSAEEYWKAH